MKFSENDLERWKNLFARAARKSDSLAAESMGLLKNKIDYPSDHQYLEASEKKLINLIDGRQPAQSDPGDLEHAASRYVLLNLAGKLADLDMISATEGEKIKDLYNKLSLDKSLITADIWNRIEEKVKETGGIVAGDGSIYGLRKYEQLDPEWATALFYNLCLKHGIIKKADFVVQPNKQGIKVDQDVVQIGIVGDWGTGPYKNADGNQPSTRVMENLAKLDPDYTIHLGDVYYAGTSRSDLIESQEEIDNLVNVWKPDGDKSLALNSNHEMYSGAHGLFRDALTSGRFSLQQGASYFALVHDRWVVFGLDSAYYDNSPLFMNGALNDENQLDFIRGIDTAGKKVIAMTHHNGLQPDGKKRLPLWEDVNKALGGRDPDFWYWGHVHNAIAYSDAADAGQTVARCIGHGAIPFAKAPGLYHDDGSAAGANNKEIAYYAGQELPVPKDLMVALAPNGFAVLTISGDSLTEIFCDQNGRVVWAPPPHRFRSF